MLNPDEKAELTRLTRQSLQCAETDNWREFENIADRLRELTTKWRRERHAHGTEPIFNASHFQ
jgi:hypothetical protein